MWNSVSVNVDVEVDIDEIIKGASRQEKAELVMGLDAKSLRSICVEKGILPPNSIKHHLIDLEGVELKRFLCDITGDSYHVDVDSMIRKLKDKL